ncbi:hypothetical protein BHM03_00059793 [Ensete ventricosum]|nr:hypothetical protein BHM03_00059793 [Ensete ventricosum]
MLIIVVEYFIVCIIIIESGNKVFIPRFAISTFTALYGHGRYISVHQVIGTWTARYRAVPPKIDHRRSIEGEKGKKKKKKRKKRREEENLAPVLARAPSLPSSAGRRRAVARGSPAPVAARTCARRRNISPRGEKDRRDIAPFLLIFNF